MQVYINQPSQEALEPVWQTHSRRMQKEAVYEHSINYMNFSIVSAWKFRGNKQVSLGKMIEKTGMAVPAAVYGILRVY